MQDRNSKDVNSFTEIGFGGVGRGWAIGLERSLAQRYGDFAFGFSIDVGHIYNRREHDPERAEALARRAIVGALAVVEHNKGWLRRHMPEEVQGIVAYREIRRQLGALLDAGDVVTAFAEGLPVLEKQFARLGAEIYFNEVIAATLTLKGAGEDTDQWQAKVQWSHFVQAASIASVGLEKRIAAMAVRFLEQPGDSFTARFAFLRGKDGGALVGEELVEEIAARLRKSGMALHEVLQATLEGWELAWLNKQPETPEHRARKEELMERGVVPLRGDARRNLGIRGDEWHEACRAVGALQEKFDRKAHVVARVLARDVVFERLEAALETACLGIMVSHPDITPEGFENRLRALYMPAVLSSRLWDTEDAARKAVNMRLEASPLVQAYKVAIEDGYPYGYGPWPLTQENFTGRLSHFSDYLAEGAISGPINAAIHGAMCGSVAQFAHTRAERHLAAFMVENGIAPAAPRTRAEQALQAECAAWLQSVVDALVPSVIFFRMVVDAIEQPVKHIIGTEEEAQLQNWRRGEYENIMAMSARVREVFVEWKTALLHAAFSSPEYTYFLEAGALGQHGADPRFAGQSTQLFAREVGQEFRQAVYALETALTEAARAHGITPAPCREAERDFQAMAARIEPAITQRYGEDLPYSLQRTVMDVAVVYDAVLSGNTRSLRR